MGRFSPAYTPFCLAAVQVRLICLAVVSLSGHNNHNPSHYKNLPLFYNTILEIAFHSSKCKCLLLCTVE